MSMKFFTIKMHACQQVMESIFLIKMNNPYQLKIKILGCKDQFICKKISMSDLLGIKCQIKLLCKYSLSKSADKEHHFCISV